MKYCLSWTILWCRDHGMLIGSRKRNDGFPSQILFPFIVFSVFITSSQPIFLFNAKGDTPTTFDWVHTWWTQCLIQVEPKKSLWKPKWSTINKLSTGQNDEDQEKYKRERIRDGNPSWLFQTSQTSCHAQDIRGLWKTDNILSTIIDGYGTGSHVPTRR